MPERKPNPVLPLNELTAITSLDGRYRKDVVELAPYVSEFNIIRTRIEVETKYLMALSDVGVVRPLTRQEKKKLLSFGGNLSLEDAQRIKEIEDKTVHDVKAMELAFKDTMQGTSLEDLTEMVHFGLTSEDVNNLTYRLILKRTTHDIIIPTLDLLVDDFVERADEYKGDPMLARSHGQGAVGTTVGHEFAVFARRLNNQVRKLENQTLEAKLNGAVGGFNSLKDAYPNIDWIKFAQNFVKSLGFKPNLITTQIAPYDDMVETFQNYSRINGILLSFDQDIWRYISDHWFAQKKEKETAAGSSTMPQKINPIRFENSEGNLGKANALFAFFASKLPVSRLQRDLSDSTVIRDMGAPLGWSLLAYKNTRTGLKNAFPNTDFMEEELNNDWSILAEPAQTRMRTYGVEDPYSLMRDKTQGKVITEGEWKEIIDELPINDEQKNDLGQLTPSNYIGEAVTLTEMAIDEIRSSRKKTKKAA